MNRSFIHRARSGHLAHWEMDPSRFSQPSPFSYQPVFNEQEILGLRDPVSQAGSRTVFINGVCFWDIGKPVEWPTDDGWSINRIFYIPGLMG